MSMLLYHNKLERYNKIARRRRQGRGEQVLWGVGGGGPAGGGEQMEAIGRVGQDLNVMPL